MIFFGGMLKVLHNPRCATSRKGLQYLRSRTDKFEIIHYLNQGLTIETIKEIFLKSNLKPIDLVRTQESYYKKYLKGKSFTQEEWINIIKENPKLLKRPIIIGKYRAVIGDLPENIENILTTIEP